MVARENRLNKKWRIKRAMQRGKRHFAKDFVISWYPNQNQETKFAFIASKKVGKAVQRNRAVRLLREATRHILSDKKIPMGIDYVIIARSTILNKKSDYIREELKKGFDQIKTT